MSNTLRRRDFLARSLNVGLGFGGASLLGTLGSLRLVNAQSSTDGDYRALVCVFLYGGNDSYNMVVPRSPTEYGVYADARQSLAVPRNALLSLDPLNPDGADYGFHPALKELKPLFDGGQLAVMANVGALIEPVTRTEFRNKSVNLPPRLFSHNDQQDFWQSVAVGNSNPSGWAGKMADRLLSLNDNRELSLNITLSGSNLWQVGRTSLPYSVESDGVIRLNRMNPDGNSANRRRFDAFSRLLAADSGPLFAREFAKVQQRAIAVGDQISTALEQAPALNASFPDNKLGASLRMVARMIGARQQLGQNRQIFFVGFGGGWDTHSNQLDVHPPLLSALSQSLAAFYSATEQLGVADQVTTFTMSDFGRTLTSNGDGSDHGWGGHQLVLGGSVQGRDIYGTMPVLDIEGPFDAGRGRIIPTTSVDQYGATLGRWFGLSDGDAQSIFPNLRRFNEPDLGFMFT